ncbi:hypothetical protein ACFCWG_48010 [Streptomyces sp. NPDC056390]|uniref:hypothetical protein n=1 Tax=Streptomyces sp. NPDC056390 TaxID=3345806 RepID=UPI0035D8716B
MLDLVAQFAGPGGGLGLPGLEICREFDDVQDQRPLLIRQVARIRLSLRAADLGMNMPIGAWTATSATNE